MTEPRKDGLQSKFVVKCQSCRAEGEFWSSPKSTEDKRAAVNIQAFAVTRLASIGLAQLVKICIGWDLPKPVSKRRWCEGQQKALGAAMEVMQESFTKHRLEMRRAANIPDDDTETLLDEQEAQCDGTWQARYGNRSLVGAMTLQTKSGKIIAAQIRNSRCRVCQAKEFRLNDEEFEKWREEHIQKGVCDKNWNGSAPAMEADMAVSLYGRLLQEARIMIRRCTMDGDSRSLLAINERFGKERKVEKAEDLNHFHKGAHADIEKAVKENNASRLGGSPPLRLPGDLLCRLTSLIGQAVRSNLEASLPDRRDAIRAVLFHHAADHSLCSKALPTLCKFLTDKTYVSKYQISPQLFEVLKPVFEKLASSKRLGLVSNSSTQCCECFHSFFWNILPKIRSVGKIGFRFAFCLAAALYNEGFEWVVSRLYRRMGVSLAFRNFDDIDRVRAYWSERKRKPEVKGRRHYNKKTRKLRLQGDSVGTTASRFYKFGAFAGDGCDDSKNFPVLELPIERPFNQYDFSKFPAPLLAELSLSLKEANELEAATREQENCLAWFQGHKKIFTASNLRQILSRKKVEGDKFVEWLGCMLSLKSKSISGLPAPEAGRHNEDLIVHLYLKANPHILARRVGLIRTPGFPIFGASPDRVIFDSKLERFGCFEAKFLYSMSKRNTIRLVREALEANDVPNDFCLGLDVSGQPFIKKNHKFYKQVLGQMAMSGLDFCDLAVASSVEKETDIVVVRVFFDDGAKAEWLSDMHKLANFYLQHAIPYLNNYK